MEAHGLTTTVDVKVEDGGLQDFKIYRNASFDELQHNTNRIHCIPQEEEDTALDLRTNVNTSTEENYAPSSFSSCSTEKCDSGMNLQSEMYTVIKVEPEVDIDSDNGLKSGFNICPQDRMESDVESAAVSMTGPNVNLDAKRKGKVNAENDITSETDTCIDESKPTECLATEINCKFKPDLDTTSDVSREVRVKTENERSDEESQGHVFDSVFTLKERATVNRQSNTTHEARLIDSCPTVVKIEPGTEETHRADKADMRASLYANVGIGFATDIKQEPDLFLSGACPVQFTSHSASENSLFDPGAETDDASYSGLPVRFETDTLTGQSGCQVSHAGASDSEPQASTRIETGFQSDFSDWETQGSCEACCHTEDSNRELVQTVSQTSTINKRFKSICTECNAAFPSLSKLKQHFRKHTGEKPFSCKQCEAMFVHLHSLKQHILIIHAGAKLHQGKQCKSSFQTSAHMQEHSRLHSGERPFVCDHCGASFAQVAGLRRHTKVHEGDRPFRCEQCTASFQKAGNLQEHIRVHRGEKPYVCKTCSASFDQSTSFELHMRKHKSEKLLTCGKCNITFTDSCEFQKHLNIHLGERSLICEHCNASFSHPSNLKLHLQIHEGNRPFQCDQCNASFSYSSSLKKHKRIHSCERPFVCKQCFAAFMHPNTLKLHLRIHTGEKPYKCTECDATFGQSGSLKQHMKIHTGEKPFACSECSSAFNHSSALVKHMRTHTGEKPFVCTQCGAAFSQSGGLKKHMNMHAGEKPYVCDQCTASFTQSAGLKKHLRTHSGETPFVCEECAASFNASRYLIRHKRIQHAV